MGGEGHGRGRPRPGSRPTRGLCGQMVFEDHLQPWLYWAGRSQRDRQREESLGRRARARHLAASGNLPLEPGLLLWAEAGGGRWGKRGRRGRKEVVGRVQAPMHVQQTSLGMALIAVLGQQGALGVSVGSRDLGLGLPVPWGQVPWAQRNVRRWESQIGRAHV